jgi:hypothetical protein
MVWRKLGKGSGPRVVYIIVVVEGEELRIILWIINWNTILLLLPPIYIPTNKYRDSS